MDGRDRIAASSASPSTVLGGLARLRIPASLHGCPLRGIPEDKTKEVYIRRTFDSEELYSSRALLFFLVSSSATGHFRLLHWHNSSTSYRTLPIQCYLSAPSPRSHHGVSNNERHCHSFCASLSVISTRGSSRPAPHDRRCHSYLFVLVLVLASVCASTLDIGYLSSIWLSRSVPTSPYDCHHPLF